MYRICVFGGTTEGRDLISFLNAQPCEITACVATEYGKSLLPETQRLTVSARRLPVDEIAAMLAAERFDLVIDATHPYAASITQSIAKACARTTTQRWRLLRGASETSADAVMVESTAQAISFLSGTEGRILLTTGSKELVAYAGMVDFAERVWVRVLPMKASLDACAAAGLSPSHIIAMQGPFSEEMNVAMLKSVGAKWLVTKDGGDAGGFAAKNSAAQKAGARLLVIGRPAQEQGMSLAQTIDALCAQFGFARTTEVFVVGIGPGDARAQTAEVREAIENTDCLIGAQRMLDGAARPGQLVLEAIAPEKIAALIAQHPECASFAVVMSGDTGFFSGTKKLLPLLTGCRVHVLPGLSSMSYLCARLGTSYEDVVPVSLQGRAHDITRDVRKHERIFALVGGDGGMQTLCQKLTAAGLGCVRVSVGERLRYPDEKVTCGRAEALSAHEFDRLSVALIENPHPDAVVTHGLPDECFLRNQEAGHVVPMTKSEVRSVCLSKLQLTKNAICWDVGAGTGSVSIEMAMQAENGMVYAIEQNADALALLARNKAAFGAENMEIIAGLAPEACKALPTPTHAFLGGTSGNLHETLTLLLERNPNIRIVATAVTLESVGELTSCMKNFKLAECVMLQVSKSRPAGRYRLMTGQNPVYIFTLQNEGENA